jgi:hypothetical protein
MPDSAFKFMPDPPSGLYSALIWFMSDLEKMIILDPASPAGIIANIAYVTLSSNDFGSYSRHAAVPARGSTSVWFVPECQEAAYDLSA